LIAKCGYRLARRLEAQDFGTPPGSVRGMPGANFCPQICKFSVRDDVCCNCFVFSLVKLYCCYEGCYMLKCEKERGRGVPVPIFCVLQRCVRYLLDRECPECVGTKLHRASPPDVTCNGSPSRVRKQCYVQDVCFSLTVFSAPARARSRVYTTRSGLSLRSNQDRSIALGVHLLRPSRGLALH
jgi:hypothetical protein